MNDQKKTGVFRVEPFEGGVALSINASVSPPQRTMFADYVQVDRTRDGVTLVFGKCDLGPNPSSVRNVLDISFPRRSFLNQLYQSVTETQPHQREPFIATAKRIVGEFGYEPIAEQPALNVTTHAGSIRANAAFFALFEDDAAIDFFHLDAQVLHALSRTGNTSSLRDVKGIIRIVVSPPILDYLLTRCVAVAETLKAALQSSPDVKQLSQG
jgi:hypothetical protein